MLIAISPLSHLQYLTCNTVSIQYHHLQYPTSSRVAALSHLYLNLSSHNLHPTSVLHILSLTPARPPYSLPPSIHPYLTSSHLLAHPHRTPLSAGFPHPTLTGFSNSPLRNEMRSKARHQSHQRCCLAQSRAMPGGPTPAHCLSVFDNHANLQNWLQAQLIERPKPLPVIKIIGRT